MARFVVYKNPGKHQGTTPYLLDVQSDLLDGLDSRIVIPLRDVAHFPNVMFPPRLTPLLTNNGQEFLLETPKMGAVPLRVPISPITSLADMRVQIMGALDFLFEGY